MSHLRRRLYFGVGVNFWRRSGHWNRTGGALLKGGRACLPYSSHKDGTSDTEAEGNDQAVAACGGVGFVVRTYGGVVKSKALLRPCFGESRARVRVCWGLAHVVDERSVEAL